VVEWSCYHDPLRLRLGFDDLSPRETTPPRQTPAAPPRFSARAFFRRTHPTTHSRRTPARRGRLRRNEARIERSLRPIIFNAHTHLLSPTRTHTTNTRRPTPLHYFSPSLAFSILLHPLLRKTLAPSTHQHATPQHFLLHIQHTNSLTLFLFPPALCPSLLFLAPAPLCTCRSLTFRETDRR
jgi:hypothetical protein